MKGKGYGNETNQQLSRSARLFWTFAIFLIVFAFTTGVLWSHFDNVLNPGTYRFMARAGCSTPRRRAPDDHMGNCSRRRTRTAPPRISPRVKRLVNWCFYASIGLALCEVAHAGGILTFESSTAQQKGQASKPSARAQAKLPGLPLGLPSKPLAGKRRR